MFNLLIFSNIIFYFNQSPSNSEKFTENPYLFIFKLARQCLRDSFEATIKIIGIFSSYYLGHHNSFAKVYFWNFARQQHRSSM